jgi:amino acid transporter
VLYLAVNAAYVGALGFEPLKRSKLAAADLMSLPLGEAGAKAISILIMISALGAVNGLLFTGMRLYSTFGSRERLFGWLTRSPSAVPYGAIAVQMIFSVGLMILFETGEIWKPGLADGLARIDINVPGSFTRRASGFDDVVAATAPVFWLFFLLTGYSLIVLRGRDRAAERPFRVPLYPLTPLLFCAASAFMLYHSTRYALTLGPGELLIVAGFMLLGVPLYALSGPRGE